LFKRVLAGRVEPLQKFVPDAPPGILAMVDCMVEPDRNRRLSDLREALAVFREYAMVDAPKFGPAFTRLAARGIPSDKPVPSDRSLQRMSIAPVKTRTVARCKGTAIREIFPWLERQFGPAAVLAAVEAVPGDITPGLDVRSPHFGALSSTWYDARIYQTVLDHLLDGVKQEALPALAHDAARSWVEQTMHGVYAKLFRMMATPALYERYVQRMWDTYYDTGTVQVRHLAPNVALHEVRNWAGHHPFVCRMNRFGGVCIYSMMGLKNVRIAHESCAPPLCSATYTWDE